MLQQMVCRASTAAVPVAGAATPLRHSPCCQLRSGGTGPTSETAGCLWRPQRDQRRSAHRGPQPGRSRASQIGQACHTLPRLPNNTCETSYPRRPCPPPTPLLWACVRSSARVTPPSARAPLQHQNFGLAAERLQSPILAASSADMLFEAVHLDRLSPDSTHDSCRQLIRGSDWSSCD